MLIKAYGYTSEFQGDYNDLVYLRARQYSPSLGRFLTRDTWEGDASKPITFNSWTYANADPILFTDPTGMSAYSYAEFVSDNPKGFHEIDKALIDSALDYIAQAYLRGYQEYVDRLMMADCKNIETFIALTHRNLSKENLFYGIHNGKILFRKINADDIAWAQDHSKSEIYVYRRGVLSNWDTYQYMGGNIGRGRGNPGDIYLRFLEGKHIDNFDRANWLDVQGRYMRFITHETAHAFDNAVKDARGEGQVVVRGSVENAQNNGYLPTPERPYFTGGFCGTGGRNGNGWQWRLSSDDQYGQPREIFADMFVGWVNDCNMSNSRRDFMNELMPGWIFRTYHHLSSSVLLPK